VRLSINTGPVQRTTRVFGGGDRIGLRYVKMHESITMSTGMEESMKNEWRAMVDVCEREIDTKNSDQ
jgi:hypothetical protein